MANLSWVPADGGGGAVGRPGARPVKLLLCASCSFPTAGPVADGEVQVLACCQHLHRLPRRQDLRRQRPRRRQRPAPSPSSAHRPPPAAATARPRSCPAPRPPPRRPRLLLARAPRAAVPRRRRFLGQRERPAVPPPRRARRAASRWAGACGQRCPPTGWRADPTGRTPVPCPPATARACGWHSRVTRACTAPPRSTARPLLAHSHSDDGGRRSTLPLVCCLAPTASRHAALRPLSPPVPNVGG